MAKHIKSLDGLRFLAVLIFFLHHAGVREMNPLACMANEFFFILSGFILTHIYYRSILSRTFSYRIFVRKRMLRILPLYFVSLIAIFFFIPIDWIDVRKTLPSFFLVNAWIPGYAMGGIGVGWFTSVIVSFYLLFPFMCSMVLNMRLRQLVILVVALFVIQLVYGSLLPAELANDWKDIFAPARLVDCFYGIVLYRLFFIEHDRSVSQSVSQSVSRSSKLSRKAYASKILPLICLIYVGAICVYSVNSDFAMISSEFFVVPVAILVVCCASAELRGDRPSAGMRFLTSAPVAFLGSMTFEIYFIHSLVFSKMRATAHFRHWEWPLWKWVLVAGVATMIGALCWHKGYGAILAYIKKKCATSR